ncbi:MAG: FadR/GntR family transcriptional regulator [Sphaerochaetaceae bacterium]
MKPVQKMPIIDQVVDSIKNSITSGEIPVGARLPSELSLCETLSVSRSTIREAFKVLQTMGYVELKRGIGAFVRDNEPHDYETIRNWFKSSASKVEDFTQVRGALESLAIKMAVQRAKDIDIQKLEAINQKFIQAVEDHNVSELARLDEEFHSQIIAMTDNSLLISINNLVAAEFKKYRVMSFSVKANAVSAVKPHQRIVEALKKRDEVEGVNQLMHHLKLVVTDMNAVIGEEV